MMVVLTIHLSGLWGTLKRFGTAALLPQKVLINPFLHLLYRAAQIFPKTFPESALSAGQGVVGAEQWETFEVFWDKESAYACLDLDGKTTAMR